MLGAYCRGQGSNNRALGAGVHHAKIVLYKKDSEIANSKYTVLCKGLRHRPKNFVK